MSATKPRFVPNIPKDISLNPQFDTVCVKMKDLFLQFVTKPSKQQLIRQLWEAAANNTLAPGKYPSPLQTDPLPSFTSAGKNPLNAPPIGRRSARPALMSLTLGPTPRPQRPGKNDPSQTGAPTMLSTIDLTRSSHTIPPLSELLNSVLEPATLTTKEATLVSLLNDVQPREAASIKSDVAVPIHFEKICRDVLGVNPLFARCLERKVCQLTSQGGQGRVHPRLETVHVATEPFPGGVRADESPQPALPGPGKLRAGGGGSPKQTSWPTSRISAC